MNCLQQRFAIQWYLTRPCIIRGPDARTTRNFGIFFKLEVSIVNQVTHPQLVLLLLVLLGKSLLSF
jgi:hypothetical protein